MGLLAARILADRGWQVVATGRDLSRFTAADRASGIVPVALDLSARAHVDAFVDELSGLAVDQLDALVCNAGGQTSSRTWSVDGDELTVAVNHLNQVALLDRLLPRLRAGARVVFTASGTHDPDVVRAFPTILEDASLEELRHPLGPDGVTDGLSRYGTSKLCLVRVVPRLARDLADRGIRVNAFDPGLMPGTGLTRDHGTWVRRAFAYAGPVLLLAPGAHRPGTSARHLADPVTGERYAAMSGAYVVDDRPAGTSIASYDMAAGDALYADTLAAIAAEHLGR